METNKMNKIFQIERLYNFYREMTGANPFVLYLGRLDYYELWDECQGNNFGVMNDDGDELNFFMGMDVVEVKEKTHIGFGHSM